MKALRHTDPRTATCPPLLSTISARMVNPRLCAISRREERVGATLAHAVTAIKAIWRAMLNRFTPAPCLETPSHSQGARQRKYGPLELHAHPQPRHYFVLDAAVAPRTPHPLQVRLDGEERQGLVGIGRLDLNF